MLPYAPWMVWVLPLIVAFTHPIWERISEKLRDWIAVGVAFVSAIFAASMIPDVLNGYTIINGVKYPLPYDWVFAKWIPLPGLEISAGVLIDSLSVFMANVVAWLCSFIFLYSIEYMHGDRGITRYWMLVNFFMGSMELLVMADNLLVMFFGWEGVGFASYALIGYWYLDEKKYWIGPYSPSHCGMKAFVTTRIGDVGLLASIIMIYLYSHTFNFLQLAHNYSWAIQMAREGILSLVLILSLLGPIGKSAQFPLHVWLPEAMAGPTTVSALIHAATMVKAGVYYVARILLVLYPIYISAHNIVAGAFNTFFLVVAWVGAFTAFLAASMGCVSDQIKKVLAYSTISQLGYMFSILGVAGLLMSHQEAFIESYIAGVSHLMSHAIFKALLFLSAGAIGHAIESYMLKDMGGLKKYMPKTFIFMAIGCFALAGIPPFNGFWSKDLILHVLYSENMLALYVLLAVTAILTVFYTFRMFGLAFYGEESEYVKHLIEEGHKPHDPGIYMSLSLAVLSIGALVSGFFIPSLIDLFRNSFMYIGIENEILNELPISSYIKFYISTLINPLIGVTALIIIVGLTPSYMTFITYKWSAKDIIERNVFLRLIWKFLYNRWYINTIYYLIFVDGFKAFCNSIFNNIECNGSGELLKKGYSSFSNIVRRVQTGFLRVNMAYIAWGLIITLIIYLMLTV